MEISKYVARSCKLAGHVDIFFMKHSLFAPPPLFQPPSQYIPITRGQLGKTHNEKSIASINGSVVIYANAIIARCILPPSFLLDDHFTTGDDITLQLALMNGVACRGKIKLIECNVKLRRPV